LLAATQKKSINPSKRAVFITQKSPVHPQQRPVPVTQKRFIPSPNITGKRGLYVLQFADRGLAKGLFYITGKRGLYVLQFADRGLAKGLFYITGKRVLPVMKRGLLPNITGKRPLFITGKRPLLHYWQKRPKRPKRLTEQPYTFLKRALRQ